MSKVYSGHGIVMFKLLSIKSRFELELKGMKGRGQTMYSLVKQQYGFVGGRQAVYDRFCQYVQQEAAKLQPGDIKEA